MKKYLALLLAGIMLLCCCMGCANKTPEVSDPVVGADPDVSTTTSTQDDTTDATDEGADVTDESADATDESADATDESADATDESADATDTTTQGDATTTSTTKGEDKVTTTKKTETTTTKKGQTTTTKKTETTTTKKGQTTTTTKKAETTTKNTTTKNTTTKNTTTKTTTTVTTTKTTTTVVTTTTTTRYRPGLSTTTSGNSGITVPSQNGVDKGYEFEPGDEWTLFWSDEFDGNTLDLNNWSYEEGKQDIFYERKDNVTVQNGNLVITARHCNPADNKGQKFSTGAVNSAGKFSFQYGRLEFRARLPYGNGVFPAFWTMGDNYIGAGDEKGWPRCGEIDVMEFIGGGTEEEKYTSLANKISTFNLHWGQDRDHHDQLGTNNCKLTDGSIWADSYHIFAIEWDENSIKFYRDDRMYLERSINDPEMMNAFHQKHWIIINVALCSFAPNIADETTPLPQSMYVDYVRVYKKK